MSEPEPHRARVVELALQFGCPACGTEFDSYVDLDPSEGGGFVIPCDQQYDLCSHCGALLDLGCHISPEAPE